MLDDEAIQSYKKRLDELDAEIREAQANADLGRVATAEAEIATLKDHLKSSLGFRGRHREVAGDDEKIRKAVSLAISRALVSFQAAHPDLFHHLLESLNLGTVLSYAPEKPVEWAMDA